MSVLVAGITELSDDMPNILKGLPSVYSMLYGAVMLNYISCYFFTCFGKCSLVSAEIYVLEKKLSSRCVSEAHTAAVHMAPLTLR